MREQCAECGFDGDSVSVSDAIVTLRSLGRRWRGVTAALDGDDGDVLRRRPSPDVWSALEYAAHARDTIAANSWVMDRALVEDRPAIEWPGDDVLATRAPSEATDIVVAVDDLAANAERLAARAERTDAGDWRRVVVVRGGMEGDVDALWLLRHAVHEGVHHLKDVERVLRAVRGR